MGNIKVLDVTLRDGGCVNDFNFGQDYMTKILTALEKSNIDYIELGYIDDKQGSPEGRTKYINENVIPQKLLKNKKPNIKYVAMIDYGKFDFNNLHQRTDKDIDGIRIAFHKKDWKQIAYIGKQIISKGYELFIQPMLTARYTDRELLDLIDMVNSELANATAFYVVDSFGELRGNDIVRLIHLVGHNLNPNITLGFHSHNNLQLSYANAMTLISFPSNRNLILDSSVLGMGKGAGNLNTELLLEHLNIFFKKKYSISPLLDLIDNVLSVIRNEFYWGYSVEYYLSSINHCTPSYASHFYNKHMLPIDQVAELLGMVAEEKRISFDKNYAEELYRHYNSKNNFDDSETISRLKKMLNNKEVLLIAPGKSIISAKDKINSLAHKDKLISISLNNFEFKTDYIMSTRQEAFEEAKKRGLNIIVPSHLSNINENNINTINYSKWIITGEKTYDSSGVILLNLLKECKPSKVYMAGFDGFSPNINKNYFDTSMRKPVSEEQAEKRNAFFKDYIKNFQQFIPIEFVTKSFYE